MTAKPQNGGAVPRSVRKPARGASGTKAGPVAARATAILAGGYAAASEELLKLLKSEDERVRLTAAKEVLLIGRHLRETHALGREVEELRQELAEVLKHVGNGAAGVGESPAGRA